MTGDQLTHGDTIRAGITSVAELSSVLWETGRPGFAIHRHPGLAR